MTEHQPDRQEAIGSATDVLGRVFSAVSLGVATHWKLYFTVLAAASAFTAGMVFGVGVGLFPLIGKADLFVILIFYASLVSILIHILLAGFDATTTIAPQLWSTFLHEITQIRKKFSWLQLLDIFMSIVIMVGYTFFATSVLAFITLVSLPILTEDPVSSYIDIMFRDYSNMIYLYAGILMIFIFIVVVTSFGLAAFLAKSFGAIGKIFVVGAAAYTGLFWVDCLRQVGPRVTVNLTDKTSLSATIVLPATNGVILFQEGEHDAQFLNWNEIYSVTSISDP